MTIEVEKGGGIATVFIAQPAKQNAVSPPMWDALADSFRQLSADPEVRCVVLRGAGTTFCSGSDLGALDKASNAGVVDIGAGLARLKRANRMVLAIHECEKPVIAAVRGNAVGVGWSIAMACDLSIMSSNARFIAAFARIGLVPDGGAIWFLSRLVGPRVAKQIAYQAKVIGADEALSLGLVNQVVTEEEFDAAVDALAADLAARPTQSLALSKRLFRDAIGPGLAGFLEAEEMAQVLAKQSPDFHEGVDAFMEKRRSNFSGR